MKEFDLNRVKVDFFQTVIGTWDMANRPIKGKIHYYNVFDENCNPIHGWQFVIRVPDGRYREQSVQVQPIVTPDDEFLQPLARRSLVFVPAENGVHVGKVYCKVSFQDPSGEKTKVGARWGERGWFPEWMRPMRHRIRLKKTVKDTRGTDGEAQVILLLPHDHKRMIWTFFATKVWVLGTGFRLRN